MKAIILISSIFYILGLKLSHKFDLVKKCDSAEKIITNDLPAKQTEKTVYFKDELKTETDSLKMLDPIDKTKGNSEHF